MASLPGPSGLPGPPLDHGLRESTGSLSSIFHNVSIITGIIVIIIRAHHHRHSVAFAAEQYMVLHE